MIERHRPAGRVPRLQFALLCPALIAALAMIPACVGRASAPQR